MIHTCFFNLNKKLARRQRYFHCYDYTTGDNTIKSHTKYQYIVCFCNLKSYAFALSYMETGRNMNFCYWCVIYGTTVLPH
jgi:hypothetical protein